ncbi:hypothetical protein [Faecalibacter bovis]|uniref:Uncharacterized protein n=1 Tax=Faecalibacter bovis TaxID=2898187 RepID=A0ABX7XCA6_9FLAO|nr:hypothetical protein [Faecalibacter bovis]QTV05460.1 hypothetical protein J9309_11905 [Faecalibacter bovis]
MKQITILFFLIFQNVYSQYSLIDFISEYDRFVINEKHYYTKTDSIHLKKTFNFLELNPDLIDEIIFINSPDLHSGEKEIIVKINYSLPQKVYQLISIEENAIIDQKAIKDLNSIQIKSYQNFSNNQFKTNKGNNRIYHFAANYIGESFTGEIQTFNDLMVLEVNPKNMKIVSGYHLTKEWAELPFSNDLYKLSAKKIVLVESLPLSLLNFKHIVNKNLLSDDGFIENIQI